MENIRSLIDQIKQGIIVVDDPVETQIQVEQETLLSKKFEDFDWKFNCFNDETLIKLFKTVSEYVKGIETEESWLTLSGPTEIGKTHLLKKAHELLRSSRLRMKNKTVVYYSWPLLITALMNDNENVTNIINNCGVLIIEEFLKERFDIVDGEVAFNRFNSLSTDLAHNVLNMRDMKPLLMDTNKTMKEFEKIDIRIASRLKRNKSTFLQIKRETLLYSQRCSS
jgi:DNA replication protein DnaC